MSGWLLAVLVLTLATAAFLAAAVVLQHRAGARTVREHDHLLTTTLDSVAATVIVVDRDGIVRYASREWTPYVQWATGDAAATGMNVRFVDICEGAPDVTPGSAHARAAVEAVLSGEQAHATVEYRCFIAPNMSEPAWLLMQVDALAADDGAAVIVLVDITDRRSIELALEASEARLRRIMDVARIGEWESDLRSGRIWWSENMYRMAGLEPDTPIDDARFYEILHPDDHGVDKAVRAAYLQHGGYLEAQLRFIQPDGRIVWVECRGERLPGTDAVVVGASLDVTARRQAEEGLRRALADVEQLRDQLKAENVYLQEELSASIEDEPAVFRSAEMRAVLAQITDVARTLTPVLITGETGTGKEVIARHIHGLSPRRGRPLVRVNCAALPPPLIESELFGHERGAFTGASARRIGRFELADGGTLLLDEVGELPLELQVKLLRALQEGEFERVGGSKTLRVSVRVIAATNRNLSASVQAGTFRADLYYRLNVFPLHVPPLRERLADIEPLATAALRRASQRVGRAFDRIPPNVLEPLLMYPWPGNVRELQNVIERATLLSPGPVLTLPDGWDRTDQLGPVQQAPEHRNPAHAHAEAGPLLPLSELERRHILRVLETTRWRINGPRGAAAVLQINPSTLRSRMAKLGIAGRESRGLCDISQNPHRGAGPTV